MTTQNLSLFLGKNSFKMLLDGCFIYQRQKLFTTKYTDYLSQMDCFWNRTSADVQLKYEPSLLNSWITSEQFSINLKLCSCNKVMQQNLSHPFYSTEMFRQNLVPIFPTIQQDYGEFGRKPPCVMLITHYDQIK